MDEENNEIKTCDFIAFDQVVQGQTSAEVCRVFIACLQLANLGNVDILKDGNSTHRLSMAIPQNSTNNQSTSLEVLSKKKSKSAYSSENKVLLEFTESSVLTHQIHSSFQGFFSLRLISDKRFSSLETFLAPSVLAFNNGNTNELTFSISNTPTNPISEKTKIASKKGSLMKKGKGKKNEENKENSSLVLLNKSENSKTLKSNNEESSDDNDDNFIPLTKNIKIVANRTKSSRNMHKVVI